MKIYLSMSASLILPNTEPVKKILCDTVLSYYACEKPSVMQAVGAKTDDELIKKATIAQILEKDFCIDNIANENEEISTYDIHFNDECSNGWMDELRSMIEQLAEHLGDGSQMTMKSSDDDGEWYESYEMKDGKLISGESHDFFTDDSDCPSDDDIADAIITAAAILVANPSARTGLAQAFGNVSSIKDIIEAMPS